MTDKKQGNAPSSSGPVPVAGRFFSSIFRQFGNVANNGDYCNPTSVSNTDTLQASVYAQIAPSLLPALEGHPKLQDLVKKSLGAYDFFRYVPSHATIVWNSLITSALASVKISKSESPELYNNVVMFIQNKGVGTKALQRHVKAESRLDAHNKAKAERWNANENDEDNAGTDDLSGVIYEGESSSWQIFRHDNQTFFYTKEENGDIRLWRLELTPRSIQGLISQVNAEAVKRKQASRVAVFTPVIDGQDWYWDLAGEVSGRPMDSVVLDANIKQEIIDEIDAYRNDPSWYSERGLPRRRGYLISGPPGTGKTSFIRAVAFKYHLNVRQLSLTQKGMDDKILLDLVKGLGPPDLILVEDIDAAGDIVKKRTADGHSQETRDEDMTLEEDDSDSQSSTSVDADIQVDTHDQQSARGWGDDQETLHDGWTTGPSNDDPEHRHVGWSDRRSTAPQRKPKKKSKPIARVTLKGVLDAFDGILSPEGHLLFMTSNHPELLDPALTRPGRVDRKIVFENATRDQLRGMFIHFFTPSQHSKPSFNVELLPFLADTFADAVPSKSFSPAKIQEYLLQHRVRPENAILGLSDWIFREIGQEITVSEDILTQVQAALKSSTRSNQGEVLDSLFSGFQKTLNELTKPDIDESTLSRGASVSSGSSTVSVLQILDPMPISDDEEPSINEVPTPSTDKPISSRRASVGSQSSITSEVRTAESMPMIPNEEHVEVETLHVAGDHAPSRSFINRLFLRRPQ